MFINCPSMETWHQPVPKSVRWPVAAGTALLLLWIFGFGLWAGLAPLSGAVIASGTFVAKGQNKLVQHLEGGIVRDIFVKEGDFVDAGQPLIKLDETASLARLRRLVVRSQRLMFMQARLQSEIVQKDAIEFPPALVAVARSDAELAEIMDRQLTEFTARKIKKAAEVEVLLKEIAGHEESVKGLEAQVAATNQQIAMFREELADKQALLKSALARKTDVLALQRAESRMTGDLAQLLARIGDTRERIARAQQQIASINSAAVQRAVEDLRATESELDDIKEQIRAARDVVARNLVTAPVRGVIVKLNQHTSGGVIQPGAVILELLPLNDDLIIESRILAHDIAHVKEGQSALVRLSALNQRLTPMIAGQVIYVSADAVAEVDPRRAALAPGTFVVRVRLDESDLKLKTHNFEPIPGMPAEIYIQTGERTFFQYLLKPLVDSFGRAFREQ